MQLTIYRMVLVLFCNMLFSLVMSFSWPFRITWEQTMAHTASRWLQTLRSVNNLSAVYPGAQPKALWRVFQGKKKTLQGTSNKTEGTAGVDPVLSRLQSCVNAYKSTLQIQRDTSVIGLRLPRPYRPPHKLWSLPKPVSSWGLRSTGARQGPRCESNFHTGMVAHLWSSFSHTVGMKASCRPEPETARLVFTQQCMELQLCNAKQLKKLMTFRTLKQLAIAQTIKKRCRVNKKSVWTH